MMRGMGSARGRVSIQALIIWFAVQVVNVDAGWAQDGPEFSAGYRQIQWKDTARERPVWADVWYPASKENAEKSVVYGLGQGASARDVVISDGVFPVVVMSHGAMGSARDYPWVAEFLARRGYIVLGVSHYEESWIYGPNTIVPSSVTKLWMRPDDCRFALDQLLAFDAFKGHMDEARVFAVGHSSGGATALMLAGARFDPALLAAYCESDASSGDRGCDYMRGATKAGATPPEATASHRDERVKGIVAMDPAAGPGFTQESLKAIAAPVLVFGAVDNDFLPIEHHAAHVAALIPKATLVRLSNGEGHFVFLATCSSPMKANGVPLCEDREGVDRDAVHQLIANRIVEFFDGLE